VRGRGREGGREGGRAEKAEMKIDESLWGIIRKIDR